MTQELLDLFSGSPAAGPCAGDQRRFGGRWRLVGAGLSNVWRYGDLDLRAPSGRMLLRGPNGTGKTTALEALWPYLLDLNSAKLAAGKARPTSLKLLMSEGSDGKRRYGYVWLSFARPDEPGRDAEELTPIVSYGVRLQYSPTAAPAVRIVPFSVPGRPLHELSLHGERRAAVELEEFTARIEGIGGTIFAGEQEYLDNLAAQVWQTNAEELRLLAGRLREVRNPTLLGDVSPQAAAAALRASLPGVSDAVLTSTADALAESKATRDAFDRDRHAAETLADFTAVWSGHVTDVVRTAHTAAAEATEIVQRRSKEIRRLEKERNGAEQDANEKAEALLNLEEDQQRLTDEIRAVELSAAYQAAGRAADLAATLSAERITAATVLGQAVGSAAEAAAGTGLCIEQLLDRREDLAALLNQAAGAGARPPTVAGLLDWREIPRIGHRVGQSVIDPGVGLQVNADCSALTALATEWGELAGQNRRRANAAQLAIKDHRTVEHADHEAGQAEEKAREAQRIADEQQQAARQLAAAVREAMTGVLTEVHTWALGHADLRSWRDPMAQSETHAPAQLLEQEEPDAWGAWDVEDLDQLADGEPASVIATLDSWADLAHAIAERRAAADEQTARHEEQLAEGERRQAADLRRKAERLRGGELLPMPRPAWTGPAAATDTLLGDVLEWGPNAADPHQRALVESALAESGLLGATLAESGAATTHWRVEPMTHPAELNLSELIAVDATHPLADTARAVLARVALADTADSAPGSRRADVLTIGRDGTFRAGVLIGHAAAARHAAGHAVEAQHVGARQRRRAALEQAARCDAEARELDDSARERKAAAERARAAARTVRGRAASFPPRKALNKGEADRAAAQTRATTLAKQAVAKDDAGKRLRQAHAEQRVAWEQRTSACDLPCVLSELENIDKHGRSRADMLKAGAAGLSPQLAGRLQRVLDQIPDEDELARKLAEQASAAQDAHNQAEQTAALLREVQTASGDSDVALARHAALKGEQQACSRQVKPAQEAKATAERTLIKVSTQLSAANTALAEAEPARHRTLAHLTALLSHPAVAQVLLPAGTQAAAEDEFLSQAATALAGRRAHNRRFLGERYDRARAELAGLWTLARADAGPGLEALDTFVLTHSEHEYTPSAAAARAVQLATRAEAALAAAEQTALTDFVIGRLPSAIGTAWTRMQDWKHEVNRKMRSAEASSGVGVQVQVELSADLSPAARTVYDLSCRTGDADRTDEQKAQVGAALQALLAATVGESMLERLTAAVDIRAWVDVHYLVSRPDRTGARSTSRWNSRTGLSGGERRLVVLAPMLAAAAAAYDRLGPRGLRLVPLDEVPAEVDERGREGLARYIAELDLDLVCTSYLWDGAPGAWDGVDAHDLEAGTDGTVVAFPMLIRGARALPDDPEDFELPAETIEADET